MTVSPYSLYAICSLRDSVPDCHGFRVRALLQPGRDSVTTFSSCYICSLRVLSCHGSKHYISVLSWVQGESPSAAGLGQCHQIHSLHAVSGTQSWVVTEKKLNISGDSFTTFSSCYMQSQGLSPGLSRVKNYASVLSWVQYESLSAAGL